MNPFSDATSAEVAEEVENERAGLVNTLDQLRENLRPENVVDEVFSQAQVNSSDLVDRIWQLARANPIPAALFGIGAAMLIGAGQRRKKARATEQWPTADAAYADPTIFEASSADIGSPYYAAADESLATGWRQPTEMDMQSTRRPLSGLSRIIDEQPLVLAAIGVALGAAVGSAIPSTEIESEWMGDASESVRQNANAAAREQISQFRTTAYETLDGMKATAADHGVSSENLSGLVHDLGEQAKKGVSSLGHPTATPS